MNAGPTSERAYDELKRRILEGVFEPGMHLDGKQLAKDLESSATPVREALHLLTGEGLVVTSPNEGFHMPHLDTADLRDLYGWNGQVLSLALARPRTTDIRSVVPGEAAPMEALVDATARLFEDIARRSSNVEHGRTIESLNDRLHAARRAESRVFADRVEEVGSLVSAFETEDHARLGRMLRSYHRRRERAAAEILRTMFRSR